MSLFDRPAPQAREHPVPCRWCRTTTWERSAVCGRCQHAGHDILARALHPAGAR